MILKFSNKWIWFEIFGHWLDYFQSYISDNFTPSIKEKRLLKKSMRMKIKLHFFETPCIVNLNIIPIELSRMNMIVKIMWILYSRIQWGIFNPLQMMRIQPIEDDTVESVARWKRDPGSRNAAHSSLVVAQFYLVFRRTINHVLTLKKKCFISIGFWSKTSIKVPTFQFSLPSPEVS